MTRHAELMGRDQGPAGQYGLVPFFGGITANGGLARTATSVRSGARTPMASVSTRWVILLAVVCWQICSPTCRMPHVARPCLLIVAWNMSEVPTSCTLLRIGPRQDVWGTGDSAWC